MSRAAVHTQTNLAAPLVLAAATATPAGSNLTLAAGGALAPAAVGGDCAKGTTQ
eukprot:CAMPEP_0197904220 /NCGR_PEP_ID=MMETSP1439-20131203/57615_1 /TAXON_ID=66791 /ORGANISM="Gonyaulax spinifera, Strain CCMP409" /LENGTH=53 /DNA_ID=CAMNT_0043525391 /DNA_START=22 /DNA_END=181 /DNA_ORIENTATION=-